jgi:hypothetical protein
MADITDIRDLRGDREPLHILEDIADAIRDDQINMPDSLLAIYRVNQNEVRVSHHADLYTALALLELAKEHLLSVAADTQ